MKTSVRKLALCALLMAFALVLSLLEQSLPVFPMLPPGVKLGLSNVAVMFSLFFLGFPYALTVGLLKALFVLLTRGAVSGLLSGAGALLSICGMGIASHLKASWLLSSVIGAILHNLGQLLVVSLWLGTRFFSIYLPVLILSGLVMGVVTGLLLKVLMPALSRLPFGKEFIP